MKINSTRKEETLPVVHKDVTGLLNRELVHTNVECQCVSLCVCVTACVCMQVCVHASICVCVCIHVHAYMCVYVSTYVHACLHQQYTLLLDLTP